MMDEEDPKVACLVNTLGSIAQVDKFDFANPNIKSIIFVDLPRNLTKAR
jgi:hypothetical protein